GSDANFQIRSFYSKQIQLYGILIGSKLELLELIDFVSEKKVSSKIDSVFPLSDVQQAHNKLERGEQLGKILLKI
ncbi:MAG: zinc-binding dehydrogenase, partial [Nitrososphaeraceae archaeon]|nr:zinc-binding dehydrogenase [Nitrososphaeraceae archaeon]MDW3653911.1 zinc-binding dehydrogenase [Nitrososphaeraceae archaeon]